EMLDPRVAPVGPGDPDRIAIGRLRVGVFEDDGLFPASPAIRRAVREAGAALAGQGASGGPPPPADAGPALPAWSGLTAAGGARPFRRALRGGAADRRVRFSSLLAGLGPRARALLAWLAALLGQQRLESSIPAWGRRSVDQYFTLVGDRDRYRA